MHTYPLHLIDKYLNENSNILEVGCGLGRVLKHYHYKNYHITGIEYDKYCIQKLKNEDKILKVYQADVRKLEFNNHQFNNIMAFGVLGHIENEMEKAFSEVNRVCKKMVF